MTEHASVGLFASLRRLLGSGLNMAEVRLELLSTDLQLEKLRVLESLLWSAFALVGFGVALLLSSLFVVLLVGEPYRLAALGVLALLHGAGGWAAMRVARNRRDDGGAPFAASLSELRSDSAALRGQREQP